MKYKIDLGVRGVGLQLLQLSKEDKDQLLNEELDEVYASYVSKYDFEFTIENLYLASYADRYELTITDENDDVVYESQDFGELIVHSDNITKDEEDEYKIKGWSFEGVSEDNYLVQIQTLKGIRYVGEFDLDEPFDESKLYVVPDSNIDDELMGDTVYPIDLYYQRGEGADIERDIIDLDLECDGDIQDYNTYLMSARDGNGWTDLKSEME